MKLEQEVKFQPITITLETEEEAEALRAIMQCEFKTKAARDLAIEISNWMCSKAQLEGM